jgi:hypothetical protein
LDIFSREPAQLRQLPVHLAAFDIDAGERRVG